MEVEGNRIFHLRVSGKKFTANSSGFLEIEIIFQPNFSICKQCSKPLHYSFYSWNYYWIRKFFWVSIVCNSHFGDNSLKHYFQMYFMHREGAISLFTIWSCFSVSCKTRFGRIARTLSNWNQAHHFVAVVDFNDKWFLEGCNAPAIVPTSLTFPWFQF